MKKAIEFKVNGKNRQVFVDPWRVLGEVLREEMGLMGLKIEGKDRLEMWLAGEVMEQAAKLEDA